MSAPCSQACVLGSLSVLIVDQACRQPLITMEPAMDTLFAMADNLPGYIDKSWTAARREAASKAITSMVQRDHEARMQLMLNGGIGKLLALLDTKVGRSLKRAGAAVGSIRAAIQRAESLCSAPVLCSTCTATKELMSHKLCVPVDQKNKELSVQPLPAAYNFTICFSQGPGHSKVQYCVATVLAIIVLDDAAMEVIKQRGEGHLVFEATLKLLSHVMNALKFSLAVGDNQILSEGMTQADVTAAMQKLRGSSAGGSGKATARHSSTSSGDPLMQTAVRRLSQEAGASSAGAPLARRLSTDAAQAAALLAEASRQNATGSTAGPQQQQQLEAVWEEEEEDVPEPLDVHAAVSLAEACAQAVWGSAHYSLDEPELHITQVSQPGQYSARGCVQQALC